MLEDEGEEAEKQELQKPKIKFLKCEPDDWFEGGIFYRRKLGPRPCDACKTSIMPEDYRLKMMAALDYLNGISTLRTSFMYQRLKRDHDKRVITDLMYFVHCQEPCVEVAQRQESTMECYFRSDANANLYSNLTVVRHKVTGELVQVGKPFKHYRHCRGPHDEDTDEQLILLHETLRNHMEKIEGASLLRSDARRQAFDQIAESTSKGPFDKVVSRDMSACISQHLLFKVSMELAEERKRAKIFIWGQRSKVGDDIYDNIEGLKLIRRIEMIDKNLFFLEEHGGSLVPCPVQPPSELDSWASLSLEERSNEEKWMTKIEEEHKQILCYVRGHMKIERAVEYIKLKMEVAKELGIWRVPVEEYWQEIPEFFKREIPEWYGPCYFSSDNGSDKDEDSDYKNSNYLNTDIL